LTKSVRRGITVSIIVASESMEKLPAVNVDDSLSMPSVFGYIRKEYKISVLPILDFNNIIESSEGLGSEKDFARLQEYEARYKAADLSRAVSVVHW
jgi:hypothetical protein